MQIDYHQVIRKYYQSYQMRCKEDLRNLLTTDFKFVSDFATYEDRDKMIEDIWPEVGNSRAEDLQIFGEYPDFMVRYTVIAKHRPSRNMAEYIYFKEEKIAGIEVYIGREK